MNGSDTALAQRRGQPPVPTLPCNVDAEEAVLGSLLIDPDAILAVATVLEGEDDFFVRRNGWIYTAIHDLHEQRKPADLVTLTAELERRGQLEGCGGASYLTHLINATPTSIHAEHYAGIVAGMAVRRRIIDAATKTVVMAYDTQMADGELVDYAESLIFSAAEQRLHRDTTSLRQAMADLFDRTEYLSQHRGELLGIPTGLVQLDVLLGGLQKSDLVILAGRPGMGKTSLAASIALHAARKYRKRVLLFSLEMSAGQMAQRFASAEARIDSQRIRRGDIHDDEWPIFVQATAQLSDLPVFIDDTPSISPMEMRSKARRLHAEYGLDLIVIDYIQLMRGDSRSENRVQEVSYISRALKGLAREINIPVLALSQLNRSVESRHDKHPMLSDLRESGSLEQDADVVLFVYRDEIYNPDTEYPNIAEIILAKHRSGPTGTLSVYFQKELARFYDLEA